MTGTQEARGGRIEGGRLVAESFLKVRIYLHLLTHIGQELLILVVEKDLDGQQQHTPFLS
jgi:hypothetical protein